MRKNREQTDWIEIVEPKTRERMYANLVTGECSWEAPMNVPVKRTQENQWWELYDSNTSRFYYYNPTTTETIWQKPSNCDIIPLAKLQLLKENTEGPSQDTHFRKTSLRNTTYRFPQCTRPETSSSCTSHNDSSHYTNFCKDLHSSLPQEQLQPPPSHNNSHWQHKQPNRGSQTMEFPKHRFPSSNSCRGRNSKLHNQEAPLMEGSPRTPVFGAKNQSSPFSHLKDFRVYSPSSSMSSLGGQSAELLSAATTQDSMATISTADRESISSKQGGGVVLKEQREQSWSKDVLKQPLSGFTTKKQKKQAIAMCKLIMEYMGDRKSKTMTDQIALSIVECCSSRDDPSMRDEFFLQIVKQLNENPKSDSIRKGWELLGVFLSLVGTPTSPDVHEKLLKFVESNGDPILDSPEVTTSQYAKHCIKRLQLKVKTPAKPTVEAIRQARYNIFYPSKFGTELAELMELQATQYPHLRIPWIEATLIRLVFESGGDKTEGLFRIASDPEQLQTALIQLEIGVPPKVKDPHVAAALLKQWLRQLPTPIIPPSFYNRCLLAAGHPEECCHLINNLPEINRLVLTQIIILLQKLCKDEETVKLTKMDVANLSMVMAPNILRCESKDPAVIFANSRKEMEFIKTVLTHYDTNDVEALF